MSRPFRAVAVLFFVLTATLAASESVLAQGSRGFDIKLEPNYAAYELNLQRDFWMLTVDFKPMRFVTVETEDPQTGQMRNEVVWYLVYRIYNRPVERLEPPVDTDPRNQRDQPPSRPLFIPEGWLVTTDNNEQVVHHDTIIPEAEKLIEKREKLELQNSVEIAGTIPELASADDENSAAVNGVFMWRGVDPRTDFFRVYLDGFTSAYRVDESPDGGKVVARKSILLDYARPGDEFDPTETEFRPITPPSWIYRPNEIIEIP